MGNNPHVWGPELEKKTPLFLFNLWGLGSSAKSLMGLTPFVNGLIGFHPKSAKDQLGIERAKKKFR